MYFTFIIYNVFIIMKPSFDIKDIEPAFLLNQHYLNIIVSIVYMYAF
jgi:hypothetical protein